MKNRTTGQGIRFVPTKAQRSKVMLLMARGLSEQTIADVIGVSHMTLRKHFHTEITGGRERKIAENMERLDRAAAKGNVSAMKYLDSQFALRESKAEPVGKKEQANREAQTAHEDTSWGNILN